ncbi:MAG: putative zinc-binding protein [Candidatus Eisenbacteria bacterium]
MDDKDGCLCHVGPKLIFACSGAADVGAIADRTARHLTKEGTGKMYCLAGIGGHVNNIVKNTEQAGKILALDGCAQDCAKRCLEAAGFTRYDHLRVTDLGMKKGETPLTMENILTVAQAASRKITSPEVNQ